MGKVKGGKALSTQEIEQAKVLSAAGHSYRWIGRELGRSDKTIKKALTKTPEIIESISELREELAGMFEGVAKRMIASITDADILKLDGYKRTLSAGIATDKAASLRGQAEAGADISIKIVIVGGNTPQQDIVITPIDKSLSERNLLADTQDEEGGPFV